MRSAAALQDSNCSSPSDRLFTLSCEEEGGEAGEAGEASTEEEPGSQTYAGVLRTPARTTDTDQLIKIRKLGTMGSMVEF